MTQFLTSISNKSKIILFIDHENLKLKILQNNQETIDRDFTEKETNKEDLINLLKRYHHLPITLFFHSFHCRYNHISTQFIPFWHRLWLPLKLWIYYKKTIFGLKKKKELLCSIHPQLNLFQQNILNLIHATAQGPITCRQWLMDVVDHLSPIPEPWIIMPLSTPTGGTILVVLKEGLPIFSRFYNPAMKDQELAATAHYLKRYKFKTTDHAHFRRYETPSLQELPKSTFISVPLLWKKQLFQGIRTGSTIASLALSVLSLGVAGYLGAYGTWTSFKTDECEQKTPALDQTTFFSHQNLWESYKNHKDKAFPYDSIFQVLKAYLPPTFVIIDMEWSEKEIIFKGLVDPRIPDKTLPLQTLKSLIEEKLFPLKIAIQSAQGIQTLKIFK